MQLSSLHQQLSLPISESRGWHFMKTEKFINWKFIPLKVRKHHHPQIFTRTFMLLGIFATAPNDGGYLYVGLSRRERERVREEMDDSEYIVIRVLLIRRGTNRKCITQIPHASLPFWCDFTSPRSPFQTPLNPLNEIVIHT